MSYGTCKVCGCTDNNACIHPDEGACWWIDDDHELCSHCYLQPAITPAEQNEDSCVAFIGAKSVLIGTLHEKEDWIDKMPDILTKVKSHEQIFFADWSMDILTIDKEFLIKEALEIYPVRIYKITRFKNVYNRMDIQSLTINI